MTSGISTGLRPMVFMDRDGVLNMDTGYLFEPSELRWVDGVFVALALLRQAGYRVSVVTNQSGVGRGFYTSQDVDVLHAWMQAEIAERGGEIAAFYSCPYLVDAPLIQYRADHPDRKPRPGMLQKAVRDFPTDLSRSFMIGDRLTDMQAAAAMGVRGFLFEGGNLGTFVQSCLAVVDGPVRARAGR